MKGDKAAAASRPCGNFGGQQPSHKEVRTPMASSYLGNHANQSAQSIQLVLRDKSGEVGGKWGASVKSCGQK